MKENLIDYFFTFDKDFELVFRGKFLKEVWLEKLETWLITFKFGFLYYKVKINW